VKEKGVTNSEPLASMDDAQFHRLLDHFSLSWAGYRKVRKGVKKRLRRHMRRLGCWDVSEYLEKISKDPGVRDECERLLAVSISRFFRDRHLWAVIKNEILPVIVHKETGVVRIWSAGCASGEEAYSFRIIWEEMKAAAERLPDLEILATDMNPVCLNRAREGIYSQSSLRELGPELRFRYFKPIEGGQQYALKQRLKKHMTWKLHHLLSKPPGQGYHLILMRNSLLTYYGMELRMLTLSKVVKRLSPKGFFIIGSQEKLPDCYQGLKAHPASPWIYKKTGNA
jgi:chemotaxis methyl-accepting protein methylase